MSLATVSLDRRLRSASLPTPMQTRSSRRTSEQSQLDVQESALFAQFQNPDSTLLSVPQPGSLPYPFPPPPHPYPLLTAYQQIRQHMLVVGENFRIGLQNPPSPRYIHSPYGPAPITPHKLNSIVGASPLSLSDNSRPATTSRQYFHLPQSPTYIRNRPNLTQNPWGSSLGFSEGGRGIFQSMSNEGFSAFPTSMAYNHASNEGSSTNQVSSGDSSVSSTTVRRFAAEQNMQLAPQSHQPLPQTGSSRPRRTRGRVDYREVHVDQEMDYYTSLSSDSIGDSSSANAHTRQSIKPNENGLDYVNGIYSSSRSNLPSRSTSGEEETGKGLRTGRPAPRAYTSGSRPRRKRGKAPSGRSVIPSSDADDEDTDMLDVSIPVADTQGNPLPVKQVAPTETVVSNRRSSTTSSSSLSSLDDKECPDLIPHEHPDLFVTKNLRENGEESNIRASRRTTTIKKTSASARKKAPVRKQRRARTPTPPEKRSSSPDYSSSPPQLGFMVSPPPGAVGKKYMFQRKQNMVATAKKSAPENLKSQEEIRREMLDQGKGEPLSMGEIMSRNTYVPSVFTPRGQGIDIPVSRTIAGRKMANVLDTWIERENNGEGTGWRGHRDNLAKVMENQRAAERKEDDRREARSAKELAAKKTESRMIEREEQWERNVQEAGLEESYI